MNIEEKDTTIMIRDEDREASCWAEIREGAIDIAVEIDDEGNIFCLDMETAEKFANKILELVKLQKETPKNKTEALKQEIQDICQKTGIKVEMKHEVVYIIHTRDDGDHFVPSSVYRKEDWPNSKICNKQKAYIGRCLEPDDDADCHYNWCSFGTEITMLKYLIFCLTMDREQYNGG